MKNSVLIFFATISTLTAQLTPPVAPPAQKKAASPPRSGRSGGVASYKDLVYPPAKPIPVPAVESITLPNGIRLFLLEDHELPIISGAARVRAGSLYDPKDKAGLAVLAGMVLRTGGSAKITGDEMDRRLESIAGSVESTLGAESGTVAFSGLAENIGPVLDTLHDILTAPEFRQEKIDLAKTQLHNAVAHRNDNSSQIAQREFAAILFGGAYGREMEHATIDAITRADLQAFHKRYFFPANVQLSVSGDFDAPAMKGRLEKLFADWTVQQSAVPDFPAVSSAPAPATYLATKRDSAQTFFAIGHQGGLFKDKDYAALSIMASILGGGPQSRLYQQLHTKKGDAYAINAAWDAFYDHPGLFLISGSARGFATVETIRGIQKEVERMRSGEVTEEELRAAKEAIVNGLVFAFDSRSKTVARVVTYNYFGYPADFMQQYQKAVENVTKADVLRVAKEQLDPSTFTILLVGNPETFDEPLEKLDRPVTAIDLKIAPPAPPLSAAASAKQILARAQQAAGGAEKLAALKDFSESTEFALSAAAGGMHVKEQVRWISPEYFRQDSEVAAGKISAWYDGSKGWIATPQGETPLAGPQLAQVQGDLFRLYNRLLLSDRLPGRTVAASADGGVDILPLHGDATHVTFDTGTGLLQSVSYDAVHAAGPALKVVESFSDFRNVNGIMAPFHIEITQNGTKFADVSVMDMKFDAGLKPADLELKAAGGGAPK